jgi:hypothetical protein
MPSISGIGYIHQDYIGVKLPGKLHRLPAIGGFSCNLYFG